MGSFTDALSGADGTADPVLAVHLPEGFADPQADQFRGQLVTVHPPMVPQVRIEAPSAQAPSAQAQSARPQAAASSAERAEAARRAVAARRDAAVASRPRGDGVGPGFGPGFGPGLAPPLPRGQAPMRLAPGDHRPMPPAYRQPGAVRPQPPAGWPPPTAHPQVPAGWPPPTAYPPTAYPPRGMPPRGMPPRTAQQRAATGRVAPPMQFGAAPGRSRAASYSSADSSRTPTQPNRAPRKKGGPWAAVLAVILFLLISGTGRQLLDAITDLLNR